MNEEPMKPEKNISEQSTPVNQKPKRSIAAILFDYVEMFAFAIFIVMVLFTCAFRICRVEGPSMQDTLYEGQTLLLRSAFYTPTQGDIVVFHMTEPEKDLEKTLVKRLIAVEGQTVEIDTKNKTLKVDGVLFDDTDMVLKDNFNNYNIDSYHFQYGFDRETEIFKTTVPEGCVFVLGDNRNHSRDSRSTDVQFVDKNSILGCVVLRFSPFTVF